MLCEYNFYKNVFSSDERKEIIDIAEKNKSFLFLDRPTSYKKVETFLIETPKIYDKIEKAFILAARCNQEFYGFELFTNLPFTINFNYYENGKEYPYHRDGSKLGMANDIKLTAIVNLSQSNYTGGEFEIFLGKDERIAEIDEPGNMIIFPSFFFHRVKPVIQGKRITMSFWLEGKNWN
jgi:predicted 2-oxoglutarate/Fe(II)-dependent dioxygenase YbiX